MYQYSTTIKKVPHIFLYAKGSIQSQLSLSTTNAYLSQHILTNIYNTNYFFILTCILFTGRLKTCIQVVLEYDLDPTISRTMDMTSKELVRHRTCMHCAADMQDFEILNILVSECKSVSDINIQDEDGNTVLHLIASAIDGSLYHQKAIMILLDKGLHPDTKNNQGLTALHFLCANRSFSEGEMIEPLIELLLNLNCDPNAMDESGCTPLIIACAHREWNVCKILLQHGADMNVPCRLDSSLLLMSQRSQSNCSEAQESMNRETFVPFTEISDCTASDLFPRKARLEMFEAISMPQTWVPDENRDRCMNCADLFITKFSIYNLVKVSGNTITRHHCRHCGRLVCDSCLGEDMPRDWLPGFIQKTFPNERKMKICKVCRTVLGRPPDEL